MIQINLNGIKWSRVLHYAITILLLAVVFFKFNGTNELKLANSSLEKDVKSYKANAKKYVNENNRLKDSITLLETRKAKSELKNEVAEAIKTNKKESEAKDIKAKAETVKKADTVHVKREAVSLWNLAWLLIPFGLYFLYQKFKEKIWWI